MARWVVSISLSMITMMLVGSAPARAQMCTGQAPDFLMLLDRSSSMSSVIGSVSKWEHAKAAVADVTNQFQGQIRFGLQLYSAFPAKIGSSCDGGQINVPVGDNTRAAIMSKLSGAYPSGLTPLGDALHVGGAYLQGVDPGRPKAIVLISDGGETCGGDAAAEALSLLFKGIKTYVIGFGSGTDPAELDAIAAKGGTAPLGAPLGTHKYYQADDPAQLKAFLLAIAAEITCCGNGVLDPGESCDPAIASGAGGACGASCNDQDPCTSDAATGGACAPTCLHSPIGPSGATKDGCCPAGATSASDEDCAPVCGNGLLEPGELCEPGVSSGAGKCVTLADCDDADPCTADGVDQSAGACAAACQHKARKADLSKKDGCCPVGANALADLDCAPGCGNGALEAGELCDPAIYAGAGKCPAASECDDGDLCTIDTLAGGACSLSCAHAPKEPRAGKADGCCPKGANALTDADCAPSCGNGVLESGELCEPGIKTGPGACKTAVECRDQDPCTTESIQGSGCQVRCASAATPANAKTKDGCCPAGLTLTQDADCLPPCDPDETDDCVDVCRDVKCPDKQYCRQGKCVPWPKASENQPAEPEEPAQEPISDETGQDYTAGSGCCRVSHADSAQVWPVLLLGAALLALARRSRRRR